MYRKPTFRIQLIYKAHGMTRPLTFSQDVSAHSVREAVTLTTAFIQSAYASGFERLAWQAENLDQPARHCYTSKRLSQN